MYICTYTYSYVHRAQWYCGILEPMLKNWLLFEAKESKIDLFSLLAFIANFWFAEVGAKEAFKIRMNLEPLLRN